MTDKTDILAKLALEIKYKRRDTIWNHLRTIVRIDDDAYSGEITANGFKIWSFNLWTGVFYPVIHGMIETTNEGPSLSLKLKLNPVGKFLAIAMTLGLIYVLITGVILQEDNSFPYLLRRSLLALVILFVPCTVFYLICKHLWKEEEARIKSVCQPQPPNRNV